MFGGSNPPLAIMKRKRDKRRANRIHASRRMGERYGLRLTKDRQKRIIEEIRLGRGTGKRLSGSRAIWTVYLEREKTNIIVVYDKRRKSIVTVLPKEQQDVSIK